MSEDPEILVQPVPWEPRGRRPVLLPPRSRRTKPGTWLLTLAVLLPSGYLLAARAVEVVVEPTPDRLVVKSALPLRMGPVRLLLPGSYVVEAEKEGYAPLAAELRVTADARQLARFALTRLPGRLALETEPAGGVRVFVDGAERGTTPLDPIELAEGTREVALRAEGYAPFTTKVEVAGGGVLQVVRAALRPDRASVTLSSDPPGATVRVDGAALGITPLTADLTSGNRRVEVSLAGYRAESRSLSVVAGQAQTVPSFRLAALPGRLSVTSVPSGAAVRVDGRFRGETPLEVEVPAGAPQSVRVTKSGHAAVETTVTLARGETRPVEVTLEPEIGEVAVHSEPADAELLVDGQARGRTGQTLRLSAAPHEIEIRRGGYAPHRTTVTPRPGFPQTVRVRLESDQRPAKEWPAVLKAGSGHELRLLRGGRYQMGASRREPGRRGNETLRDVELERLSYLGVREVTNAEFRRFKADHTSGRFGAHELGGPDYPVVNVTWAMAAEYCNWLSAQEGLPAVYAARDGALAATSPLTVGYRLPTEAEWSRAARYAPDGPLRFPWGPALPAAPRSGNFADESARSLVAVVLQGYDDRHPASAPAGSFPPNGLGFLDLAGNAAEWVHDVYAIPPADGPVEKDPAGPPSGELHVILGSSFLHGSVSELRLSYRDYGSKPRPDVGFRVARYAE